MAVKKNSIAMSNLSDTPSQRGSVFEGGLGDNARGGRCSLFGQRDSGIGNFEKMQIISNRNLLGFARDSQLGVRGSVFSSTGILGADEKRKAQKKLAKHIEKSKALKDQRFKVKKGTKGDPATDRRQKREFYFRYLNPYKIKVLTGKKDKALREITIDKI